MQRHHERAAETGAEQDTQAVAAVLQTPNLVQVQSSAEDAAGRKPESVKINRSAGGVTQQNRHRSLKESIPHP